MRKKIQVSLSEPVAKILEEMMTEDFSDNISAYMNSLVVWEKKRRDEIKNKRSVGRPKKSDDEEDVDWEGPIYDHPDEFQRSRKYYKSEIEAWNALKNR